MQFVKMNELLPGILLITLKFIKMKQIKLMLFASAFLLALAGAFAFSTPAKQAKNLTVYHYTSTSTDFNDMKDVDNWLGSTSTGCNEVEGSIPCAITYTGGNFAGFLNDLGSSSAIVEEADTKRYP